MKPTALRKFPERRNPELHYPDHYFPEMLIFPTNIFPEKSNPGNCNDCSRQLADKLVFVTYDFQELSLKFLELK